MASRRDQFRRQLERLESAGGPQKAIEAGLYVARPWSSERLVRRIELRPKAIRGITGPIGSGKSTELLVLANVLSQFPDVWPVVVDVSLVHDLSDLQEGSLVAAASIWLQEREGLDNSALRKLREVAYGREPLKTLLKDAVDWSWKVTLGLSPPDLSAPARGVLQPPRAGAGVARALAAELRRGVNEAVSDVAAERKTPIFLFDSLDRVNDPQSFRTVLERDAGALVDNGFGVILTTPVTSLWSNSTEFRSLFESWDTLPYVDPTKDQSARDFLFEVLERRLDDALVPHENRPPLVWACGGVLRDLIELARNAVEEAYMNGRDAVAWHDVQASIARFARGLSLGLSSTEIERLLKVQANHQVSAFDELTLRLLANRQILEHHDPETGPYFEAHPALASSLERWAKAS